VKILKIKIAARTIAIQTTAAQIAAQTTALTAMTAAETSSQDQETDADNCKTLYV
jgi:hypothetical protein